MVKRTKRLSIQRALDILQMRFGTQIYRVDLINGRYMINCGNSIWVNGKGERNTFSKNDILEYEDSVYSRFGF